MPESPSTTLAPPATPASSAAPAPPLRVGLALLAVALMPFPIVVHGWGDPKLAYDYVTILFPVDLALAGLIAVGIGPFARRLLHREAGLGVVLWSLFTVVMSVAWLVHPSARGLHKAFELWGVAVLVDSLTDAMTAGFGGLVVGTVATVAVLETVWATLQQITRSGLGLTRLGEDAHPFYPFSASVWAPMGSMVHPYVLAGLALVAAGTMAWWAVTAARPGRWLALAALAIAPVGFTFSRAALLSVALLAGGFAVAALRPAAPRRRCAAAAVILCVGFAVPAVAWNAGWRMRAGQTTSATSAESLTTDRGTLLHQGLQTIAADPVAGIGPGRYVIALKARTPIPTKQKTPTVFKPVHNVVLLVGAEGGVAALVLMAALYLALGWRSLRAGPAAVGVYLAYVPFSMLDHFPYSYPQGLVITAVWLAVLDFCTRRRPARSPAA